MYRNAKKSCILGLRCRKLRTFPGKFLNFGKSAGVKDLTNIMSGNISGMVTTNQLGEPRASPLVEQCSEQS